MTREQCVAPGTTGRVTCRLAVNRNRESAAETAIEGEGYGAIDRRSAKPPNKRADLANRRCILPRQGIRPVHGGEAVRNAGCPLRRKAEDRGNIRQKRICDEAKWIDLLVAASVKIP